MRSRFCTSLKSLVSMAKTLVVPRRHIRQSEVGAGGVGRQLLHVLPRRISLFGKRHYQNRRARFHASRLHGSIDFAGVGPQRDVQCGARLQAGNDAVRHILAAVENGFGIQLALRQVEGICSRIKSFNLESTIALHHALPGSARLGIVQPDVDLRHRAGRRSIDRNRAAHGKRRGDRELNIVDIAGLHRDHLFCRDASRSRLRDGQAIGSGNCAGNVEARIRLLGGRQSEGHLRFILLAPLGANHVASAARAAAPDTVPRM